MYNSISSSTFTELYNHRPNPVVSAFLSPHTNPSCPLSVTPHSHPQPQVTTNLLSVPMDLPLLDISHTWNHTTCDLWSLASFIQPDVFEVLPCCSRGWYVTPVKCRLGLNNHLVHGYIPLFYSVTSWWTLGCFKFLAALHVQVHVSACTCAFMSLV